MTVQGEKCGDGESLPEGSLASFTMVEQDLEDRGKAMAWTESGGGKASRSDFREHLLVTAEYRGEPTQSPQFSPHGPQPLRTQPAPPPACDKLAGQTGNLKRKKNSAQLIITEIILPGLMTPWTECTSLDDNSSSDVRVFHQIRVKYNMPSSITDNCSSQLITAKLSRRGRAVLVPPSCWSGIQ